MALKAIKNKIRAVQKTGKVTKAMEAVSAVKMRKAQERAITSRPYSESAVKVLLRVIGSNEGKQHALVTSRTVKKLCLVVITSDKGLAGALNSGVLKAAHEVARKSGLAEKDIEIVAIGKKAAEYFGKRGFTVAWHIDDIEDSAREDDISKVTEHLTRGFLAGAFDECVVVYTNFISTFEQQPKVARILPLSVDALTEIVKEIVPKRGKFAESQVALPTDSQITTYTVEPSEEEVLGTLIPLLINVFLYHAVLESRASEHSARMVAMKSATDKSKEVARTLTIKYNKARQAAITREVSEIVGGMEAMSA